TGAEEAGSCSAVDAVARPRANVESRSRRLIWSRPSPSHSRVRAEYLVAGKARLSPLPGTSLLLASFRDCAGTVSANRPVGPCLPRIPGPGARGERVRVA